jgi:hypothetical protein
MNQPQRRELNPIIVKELRSRMRGARAFAILTASLTLMGGFGYALYRMTLAATQYTSSPISPQVGQMLFTGLAFMELMIIAAVTPSITAGEISGEKEKQTYEMLLTTPLSPSKILWGKLVASMSYVFLLVFAAVPMASLVFIFGGRRLTRYGQNPDRPMRSRGDVRRDRVVHVCPVWPQRASDSSDLPDYCDITRWPAIHRGSGGCYEAV